MNFLYVKESNNPINTIEENLQKTIKKHNFGILGVIDLQQKMKEKGVDFGRICKIYEVCNPHRAKQVLDQEMSISTVLPCRISIYEEGGAVKIATTLPTETLKLFKKPELLTIAAEVEGDIKAMIDDTVAASG